MWNRSIVLSCLFLLPSAFTSFAQSESAARVYQQAAQSVFLIGVRSEAGAPIGQASGFLVSGNKIITNEHVVRDGIPYLDLGAAKLPLKIQTTDTQNDLAILTAEGELSAHPLVFAGSEPQPGTAIYAIGNPAGLERSISTGVVAATRKTGDRELLQITSPISPGSSGGPILNEKAEVVAVAVGILEQGQNLNFAVPIKFVSALLRGESAPIAQDLPTLLTQVDELVKRRAGADMTYSEEPESAWVRSLKQIEQLLRRAITVAEKDGKSLKVITEKCLKLKESWETLGLDPAIAVSASQAMVRVNPSPEARIVLAKSLKVQFDNTPETGSSDPVLQKAEREIRAAFASLKQPTLDAQMVFADILEGRELNIEAKAVYTKAYDIAKTQGTAEQRASCVRGIVRVSSALSQSADVDRWFKVLADSGEAGSWDWQQQAQRLYERKDYASAGDHFASAASNAFWRNYCAAANAYSLDGNKADRVLEMARACIQQGATKKNSDAVLAHAHYRIATVLNSRGVYEEALGHAREAVTIAPEDAFFQDELAESFLGLRRFQEAINASKQAIRLSDGKYSWTHFNLGSAYFELKNWELARQSYEKAAELNKTNFAAAYNVALCFVNIGYYRDAASWYEEALRRDPNNPQRADILARIQILRK